MKIDRAALADEIKAEMLAPPQRRRRADLVRNANAAELGHSWSVDHIDPPVLGDGLRWRSPPARYTDSNGQPMTPTSTGFAIACCGCGKRFDSKGLAFCSQDCARAKRDRDEASAIAVETGHQTRQPRICAAPGCGKRIPRYTASGRATAAKVRWCCQSHRKAVLGASEPETYAA